MSDLCGYVREKSGSQKNLKQGTKKINKRRET